MLDAAGIRLRTRLQHIFQEPVDTVLDEARFDGIARDIFQYQFEHNEPYRAYCLRRQRNPANVTEWTGIPPVPTQAFKHVDLVAGDKADAEAVYRTSGTTAGLEQRGTNYVLDLSLYNCSLIPGFAARLLPDAAELPILSLIPRDSEVPDSSLAHMVAVVMQRLGTPQSGYFADAVNGIDIRALENALHRFIDADTPVCLLGTSFSFVHWLDDMTARNARFVLPTGSRLMDTGGYKGRSREVPAEVMLTSYEEMLSIPAEACVNEYGMTELCSQMYDVTLSERVRLGTPGTRRKRPPPWMRIRIVDPLTLEPVEPGQQGLVQIFDLANIGSVIAVQTEDVGIQIEDGYRLLGRTPGAQPRGCSIAMDDLMLAVRNR
jgi:hypothetical protein